MRENGSTNRDWHTKRAGDVVTALGGDDRAGLDEAEAGRRLERDGPNRLSRRRGRPAWRRLLDQFIAPLVLVLIVAVIVSIALGDYVDAAVIGAVVLLNALIGFFQEQRAESAIAALDALVVTEATVLRGGHKTRVRSEQLVVGDLVELHSGDSVPADLRLLRIRDLHVDEAPLTGESVPVRKQIAELSIDTVLADRTNLAFAGTAVTYGSGTGIVIATGDATETGRIAGLIASADEMTTPLTRRIEGLSRALVWIILAVAAAAFALEAVRRSDLAQTFNAAVALAVGAIPEGLPAAVTVLLAVGVSQMAKRRALVRRLPAVETLGSTSVICSDKTGTLTENQMTVTHVWAGGTSFGVKGVGYDRAGGFVRESSTVEVSSHRALLECVRAGALCNDTRVLRGPDGTKVEGDPTEAALVVLAEKAGGALALEESRRLDVIAFESDHMYMATLDHDERRGQSFMHVKGSSDVLLDACTDALDADGARTAFDRAAAAAKVDELASRGLRILVVAKREMPAGATDIVHADVKELTFLGLVGMIDPPRAEAKRAVASCHAAGVKVKMITGDHAVTASAIADDLGLEGERDASGRLRAITGRELEGVSDEALPELAERASVFARVAPEQKLRLVRALQKRGHVVAMTGDGVNDAPALKQADIGVAMGKNGTDVARGAAAMILTDDNFATIEAAIEEGRRVYDNLVKFIAWTLPTNGGEGLVLLAAIVAETELPILPVQILWVNLATAVLLGVTLVFEKKEPGVMSRPPRDAKKPLLDVRLAVRTLIVSCLIAGAAFGFFEWAYAEDPTKVAEARTIATNTIVVVEVGYLFSCRSLRIPAHRLGLFTNKWVWGGAIAMLACQLLFTYAPFMNVLFHSAPIEWRWWGYFAGIGLVVYVLSEVSKAVAPVK
ncbi:cation-translocating P-type ATPase [Sandaracinus amylolyticus]|uniref:Cation-transporting ATPase n=1 Tax=Sandaracinus amylolyticus TaxID=927083 RepID=A0A0F6YLM5_9BACT|nr:HAD-IC family P-type ATPase [Sandaracinus amylolyticus]AKF09638.1 Cation-transporting ATPase [Sandaracinus amylolyticus]